MSVFCFYFLIVLVKRYVAHFMGYSWFIQVTQMLIMVSRTCLKSIFFAELLLCLFEICGVCLFCQVSCFCTHCLYKKEDMKLRGRSSESLDMMTVSSSHTTSLLQGNRR